MLSAGIRGRRGPPEPRLQPGGPHVPAARRAPTSSAARPRGEAVSTRPTASNWKERGPAESRTEAVPESRKNRRQLG